MLLKRVGLALSPDEYAGELTSEFVFRTRYLCNYVNRALTSLRFATPNFRQVIVRGVHSPIDECLVVPEASVRATVRFDEARYRAMGPDEHHEFFLVMLEEGLEKCARHHEIPIDFLRGSIRSFRDGGYRNEWVHQQKLLRPAGIRASLLCRLDSERFELTLRLERQGLVTFERVILETKPDELIFAYRFKEVVLRDDEVVVLSKFGEVLYSVPIANLAKAD